MPSILSQKTIGFIGAGNMAQAMIQALRHNSGISADQILAADPGEHQRNLVASKFQIRSVTDNAEVFDKSDIVILAVKPQQLPSVIHELTQDPRYTENRSRKLIISIAAGIPLPTLEHHLTASLTAHAKELIVPIRIMPNTPALVGCGMSGLSRGPGVRDEDMELAMTMAGSMGKVCVLPETLMDALTALSGSGPAYLFLLAEAMIQAGTTLGISNDDALTLTVQTLKGAIALMENGGADTATLRQRVTSPGGTTAAALAILEEGGFTDLVTRAITAARDRSRELSSREPETP
ncbi:pyrroline-5-carboxylate reductase [Desulfobotulus sp. H1]|uniref:Pyrroline-5-carboxylate reductase n=1 Tax=Desulfobotulus pelophilus TaxID=2823377 RepID=A0ABT3N4Z0_9BACT|nr:pyrroline-5-carboxylate reductase [Desulfobotulus pelophilus]